MRQARRVLFLTSNYPRWPDDSTTPFVHDLAAALVGRGWSVTVLAPHAPGAARRETVDGVAVHRFRYLLPEKAQIVCYGGGALVNLRGSKAAKAAVPALVVAEWAATARRLVAGADVVHAHWTLPQGFVAATTPYRRVPRVLTVHGGDVYGLRGGMLDRFSRYALRSVDHVTVGSGATEAVVRELAGPRVAITRVPVGVDLNRKARPELVAEIRHRHRRGQGPLLVFVGRVVEEKGVDDLVRAVRDLSSDLPDVSAVIAGSGQHAERTRALAHDLGVGGRIHMPGWVDPTDVPSWFAAADVVVAPSRIGADGWAEGQGLSIIEAMATGRPVVATRTGGIPETVTDGETGVLVPPAEPAAIAAAVRTFVADPEEGVRMGERAAASVAARFSRESSVSRFEAIYRHVIGGTKTADTPYHR
jgi:glycosyltransferase involved in cell wall biosynthesis